MEKFIQKNILIKVEPNIMENGKVDLDMEKV
jgi:hypothetical protein